MVKFRLSRNIFKKNRNSGDSAGEVKPEKTMFFIYLEYASGNQSAHKESAGSGAGEAQKIFCAWQAAEYTGHGFLEVIHPSLAVHQIRCSRNQIQFGLVFKLDPSHDIDDRFTPDFSRVVWQKNPEKYDNKTVTELIGKARPHKIKFGNGAWEGEIQE